MCQYKHPKSIIVLIGQLFKGSQQCNHLEIAAHIDLKPLWKGYFPALKHPYTRMLQIHAHFMFHTYIDLNL